ncbi:MAG: hypothetical protein U0U66_00070 [Cytophagaceae bacterium]
MHRSLRVEEIIKKHYGKDFDDPSMKLFCSSHGEGIIIYMNGEENGVVYHILHFDGIKPGDLSILEEHSAIWDFYKM